MMTKHANEISSEMAKLLLNGIKLSSWQQTDINYGNKLNFETNHSARKFRLTFDGNKSDHFEDPSLSILAGINSLSFRKDPLLMREVNSVVSALKEDRKALGSLTEELIAKPEQILNDKNLPKLSHMKLNLDNGGIAYHIYLPIAQCRNLTGVRLTYKIS